ncbi:MAG TPA: AAA family ATPase [Actinomycetales bacterium]|nr:AAA family ATPase [Actinomycetales bacterium]
MTILLEPQVRAVESVQFALPGPVTIVDAAPAALRQLVDNRAEVLLVVGADVDQAVALQLSEQLRVDRPEVGVVLLRQRLDVTVLAHSLRAGVREVVNADDHASLGEACRRSVELSHRMLGVSASAGAREARLVTVFSAKGGCGKTTVATNLAAALADGGTSSVCLVDLDLAFGDVAIALQLVPARTTIDAVAMSGSIDEMGAQSLVTPHSPGLDAICAPLEPGEAERIPASTVVDLLRVLKRMYDYVVIDTPPAFTEHVLAAFDVSDVYVLLATLDIPALKNLRLTLDMLDVLGYPRDSWQVVLNRSDSRVGLSVDDVVKTLKAPLATQIPSSRAVSASINKGVPIVLDEPRHPVSAAIRQLADREVRVPTAAKAPSARADASQASRSRSFLRRSVRA